MKKHTIRSIIKSKNQKQLNVLTCYDYQTAQMLNETDLDMILVGDSLGNVILGYPTTVPVTLNHMEIFGQAVKRGASNKFVIVDMPFGTYAQKKQAIKNGISLFQKTQAEAIKLEGASKSILKSITELTQHGVPVMGHIGLTPQSVHQLGGYYTHGKTQKTAEKLITQAKKLEQAGCFAIVLECITTEVSAEITSSIAIPTIGIGSGTQVDGQVLVTNDLFHLGPDNPPSFCLPVANLYEFKKNKIQDYLGKTTSESPNNH